MPARSTIFVGNILLSHTLPPAPVLTALSQVAPELDCSSYDVLDSNLRFQDLDHWDKPWTYKSLCIFAASDTVPVGWESRAVHAYKRPILIYTTSARPHEASFTLFHHYLSGGIDVAMVVPGTISPFLQSMLVTRHNEI